MGPSLGSTTNPSLSDWGTAVIGILPGVLWVALAALILIWMRRPLRELVNVLAWRVKAGAPIKLSALEFGAIQISPATKRPNLEGSARKDVNNEFHALRSTLREHSLFIVHRISPSAAPNMLYDVLIYIVPGIRHGTLLNIFSVEYYFGKYWDSNIFTSVDRSSAFSISTAAYAPFTCTARVRFTDGKEPAILHRFIDFEMGSIGSAPRI